MIILRPVKPEERELLWNINQKYLYEMTFYYPDELDDQGNLHYGYFDEYFKDPLSPSVALHLVRLVYNRKVNVSTFLVLRSVRQLEHLAVCCLV